MRRLITKEAVDLQGFNACSQDTRDECDRQAETAVRKALAVQLTELSVPGMVRIASHGILRSYTASLMVGTEDEYKERLKDATKAGQTYGHRLGTQQGLDVGRLEGHRSGKHAAEAEFRRMPLWRKVYHHFAGF